MCNFWKQTPMEMSSSKTPNVSHTTIRADRDLWPLCGERKLTAQISLLLSKFLKWETHTHVNTHLVFICVCDFCRAAEPRPRAGEGGWPFTVGRSSHHVWRWTPVWGKERHLHMFTIFISTCTNSVALHYCRTLKHCINITQVCFQSWIFYCFFC